MKKTPAELAWSLAAAILCLTVGAALYKAIAIIGHHRDLLESVRAELQASSHRRQHQLPLWFNTITNIDGSLNLVFINGSLSDVQIGTLTPSNSFLLVSNKLHMIER